MVKSGVVSQKADRFYVSVVLNMPAPQYAKPRGEPLGIDLGLKDFAILSDGTKFKNINKTVDVRRLEKSYGASKGACRGNSNARKRKEVTNLLHSLQISQKMC